MKVVARFILVGLWLTAPVRLTAGPAGDARIKSREHFIQAEAHYKLGRFQKALQEYTLAYELAPLPGFLFNIGQCHRKLGNDERAVFFYRGYLRDKPDARNARLVMKLIRAAEKRLDSRRQEEERRVRESERIQHEKDQLFLEQARLEEQKRRLALERERQLTAQTTDPSPPPAASGPEIYEHWWFWAIIGGAVVVTTGGAIIAASQEDKMVLPAGDLGTLDLRR